jgi:hypothetical protein
MMGIAGQQVRFEAREPIVAFFAAFPGNSRYKTVYMIFGLKFPFTKKTSTVSPIERDAKKYRYFHLQNILQLVLPSVQTPHPDILK